MEKADMEKACINGGHILTCGSGGAVVRLDASIFVEGDKITHVGEPTGEYRASRADVIIDAKGSAIIPGLINLHTHSGPMAVRGLAEDLPLTPWLETYVNPAHKYLTADDAHADYMLSYLEMLRAGITNSLDMYRFVEEGIKAANEIGIRTNLAPYCADLPQYDYFEDPDENIRLVNKYSSGAGNASVWLGFEHTTYCTDETLAKFGEFAQKKAVRIHTHESETKDFVENVRTRFKKGPIEVLKEYGLLGPRTVLAHCVWLTDQEIEIVSSAGASISHNPTSNAKLASGIAPVARMIQAGINIGLGSDGVKENNRMDLFQEMKTASILQRLLTNDAGVLRAEEVFRMATLNGNHALGMAANTGIIAEGFKADMVLIGLKKPHLTPIFGGNRDNILAAIVYAVEGEDVDTVIVDGKVVLKDRKPVKVNEEEVMDLVRRKSVDLLDRMGLKARHDGALG